MNFENLTILIVDDDHIQIKILLKLLEDKKANLVSAKNGLEALEIYKKRKVDLILTDLSMPKMDGIEFIEKVRENNFWIPIVVVTSNLTPNYFVPCANSNIQGLIDKPITKEKLDKIFAKLDNYDIAISENNVNKNEFIVDLDENLQYDLTNSCILLNNEEISLNKKERLLLELLIDKKNSIVSYKNIETVIWYYDDKVMTADALKNVIKSLRKKLNKDIIKNVSGLGYKIII